MAGLKKTLLAIYDRLYEEFGPRHWWPADTPLEVIVGAILTQNTAWSNVERAITNLKKRHLLNIASLAKIDNNTLARFIRPAGYYNIKAKRLKNFIHFLLRESNGSLKRLFKLPTVTLREKLLGINGIGPETADSIILYAAGKPLFVVDAYTKRVFSRHKIVKSNAVYEEIQALFMKNMPIDIKLFNEYHALIVHLGKSYCRKRPLCNLCPLFDL